MTTRSLSRLFIAIAGLALTALLFSGLPTSAAGGGGGKSVPTAPTNLVASAITETTVSLSWKASTSNSGRFSYRVKIANLANSAYTSLATVSQTQTTYTAKFLSPNTAYNFSVYAVDFM